MTQPLSNNVVRYLEAAARHHPDRIALVMPGNPGVSISYGDLWNRVSRLSHGFQEAGLRTGDRVICMVPMSIDLYAVLLGLLRFGAVVVFVDPWIGVKQIASFAAHATPRGFIGIPKSHIIRLFNKQLRALPVSVTTGQQFMGLPAHYSLRDLERNSGTGETYASHANDPALITFTSGSSGEPKGANRTHGFLNAQHQALRAEFPYDDNGVDMPMFPVFALNNLAWGITSVIPDMDFKAVAHVNGETILKQMEVNHVTSCTASPPFFDRLCEHLRSHPAVARHSLKRILTGGAPVSDTQLRAWQASLGATDIQVVYGSTEAEPVGHIGASQRLAVRSATHPQTPGYCVGTPVRHVKARVIRITSEPITMGQAGWTEWDQPTGSIGELVVTGDHVCKDYYLNPAAVLANKITELNGTVWHRMGDTGYFDTNGHFWITGRVHSTILRAGGYLHPQLVEQAALAGDIFQVAAVGHADPQLGQKAYLVVYDPAKVTSQEQIEERLRQAGMQLDGIIFRDTALPVDPRHNSKIDYSALAMWLSEHLTQGGAS